MERAIGLSNGSQPNQLTERSNFAGSNHINVENSSRELIKNLMKIRQEEGSEAKNLKILDVEIELYLEMLQEKIKSREKDIKNTATAVN